MFYLKKLLRSKGHLIDDVNIVGYGLVVHAPATIDKLQLTIVNQVFYLISTGFILRFPPSMKESNLDEDESRKRVKHT